MSEIVKMDRDAAMEAVVMNGDLSKLNAGERVAFLFRVCESLGLNPLTRPFDFINLNGKLTFYARKDATEQLRTLRNVSITRLDRERTDDLYIVTATAVDGSGRTDIATGAVPLGSLRGEALANAIMKAETKAKRRVTLSICGLGMLDESEIESIPGARVESVAEHTAALPSAKAEPVDAEVVTDKPAAKPEPDEFRTALDELGGMLLELDGKQRTTEEVRRVVNIKATGWKIGFHAALLRSRDEVQDKLDAKEAANRKEAVHA